MKSEAFTILPEGLLSDCTINHTAKLVFACLRDYYNRKTGQCNPHQTTLAQRLCVSLSTIERALRQLRKAGWIQVTRTLTGNRYVLFPPVKNDGCAPVKNDGSLPSKMTVDPPVHPYMNQTLLNQKGAPFPINLSERQSPVARKPIVRDRALEAYYAMQRRKAGK